MKINRICGILALCCFLCNCNNTNERYITKHFFDINKKWNQKDTLYFENLFFVLDTTKNKNTFYHALYDFSDASNFVFFRVDSINEKIFVFKDLIFDDSLELIHKNNIVKCIKIYEETSLFLKDSLNKDSIEAIRDKYWTSKVPFNDSILSQIKTDLETYYFRNLKR